MGRKYTEETLLKMSESQKIAHSKKTSEQIQIAMLKIKETKIKNGTTGKGKLRPEMKGDLNPAKKEEARKKISDHAKNTPFKCEHCVKNFNKGHFVIHLNFLKRKGII